MADVIRCPQCGGTNVECIEKPHHDHWATGHAADYRPCSDTDGGTDG